MRCFQSVLLLLWGAVLSPWLGIATAAVEDETKGFQVLERLLIALDQQEKHAPSTVHHDKRELNVQVPDCDTVLRTFTIPELKQFLSDAAVSRLDPANLALFIGFVIPQVKYRLSLQKICATCGDFPGSCEDGVYGSEAMFSGMAMFPLLDNEDMQHVPGTHVGSFLMHGTQASSLDSPSQRWANGTLPTAGGLSLAGLLMSGITASVTILPDGFGYIDSALYEPNGVYRSYLVRDTYPTSSIPLWYRAKQIVQQESNCSSAIADAAVISGYSEGGYASVALSEAFRERGDVKVVKVFSGAGPYKLSTEQLRFSFDLVRNGLFDLDSRYYIALLGGPFSSTNPTLPNYQAGQDFFSVDLRQTLVDVVNDGSTLHEINAAVPTDLLTVVDPLMLQLYLEATDRGELDPCTTSVVTGESDLICQAFQQQDLAKAMENDVNYPVEICFGANDNFVTPNNVPNISLNPFLTYTEKPGAHVESAGGCLFDTILFYLTPSNVETYPVTPLHLDNGCPVTASPTQAPSTLSPTNAPSTDEPVVPVEEKQEKKAAKSAKTKAPKSDKGKKNKKKSKQNKDL